jgi:hypothetical protein
MEELKIPYHTLKSHVLEERIEEVLAYLGRA